MATTFVDYTGDGNATKSFSFPSIQESDIKVDVDGVIKSSGTHYNITSYSTTGGGNVVFTSGNIPASPAAIRIFRDTDVDSAKATYTAGSSVKAADLNANHEQLMFAAQEEQNQNIIASDIKDGAITSAKILDGTIATADIAADAITGAKIADDQINSEHYVDGSIDTAHIADSQITTDKIANSAVVTTKIADNAITQAKIANDALTGSNMAAGTITSTKLADNAVTADKLAHTAVTAGSYTATDITVDAQGRITAASSGAIATSEITDGAVTTAKIAADAITGAKIADDAIDSEHYTDGSIDTAHIADTQVTDAKLASNAVTTSKITDANVTTAKIADSNITLAKLASDLKQTTLSDSDTQLPTSGAVIDYVTAQIAPIGGLEVIATEVAFPNTQPQAGVVISISDAAGVVVNGSGTSTTGRTVGGSTVTINNFPSSLNSETLATGVGLMVSSTGSSQTYNYHKILAAETDVKQLSDDINDFNARYRVGSSNPTSDLDGGDLFFNTTTGKLLVYNNTNTAWEEAQSIGNFFISTLSPAFNGSTQDFTITNAPTNAQQILLSINGVVQKPNSGTSTPSEGFALSGNTVKLAAAPASGSDYFAVVIGSTVNIGTPSDGTVSTAKLTSGAVTTAKIADNAITQAKVADDAVGADQIATNSIQTNRLQDSSVTTAKIADSAITNAKVNASAAIASSKLSFTQTGTGAAARTIDSKLKDFVSVKDFGAVGDGSTDDTTAFQNAINTGKPVYVPKPADAYKITDTLTLNSSYKALIGDECMPVIEMHTDNKPAIEIVATSSGTNEYSRVENLYIKRLPNDNVNAVPNFSATITASLAGVVVSGNASSVEAAVQYTRVSNLRVGNFAVGFYFADCVGVTVHKCFTQNLANHSSATQTANGTSISSSMFGVGFYFEATRHGSGISPLASIELVETDDNREQSPSGIKTVSYYIKGEDIRDIFFQRAESTKADYGWYIDVPSASPADLNWDVHIIRPIIDQFGVNGIFATNLDGVGGLTITGGYFVGSSSSQAAIYASNSNGISISGGTQILGIDNNTANDKGVEFSSCSSCSVVGNRFGNCRYGVYLNNTTFSTVVGNIFSAASTESETAPTLTEAISLNGTSTDNSIVDNTIKGKDSTHKYAAGIAIASTASNTRMIGNTIDSATVTDNIVDRSTSSITGQSAFKNRVMNGNINIWQRATTIVNTTSAYTADRWKVGSNDSNISVNLVDDDTSLLALGSRNAARVKATSNAPSFIQWGQQIEYNNCWDLQNKKVTISFLAKALVDTDSSKQLKVRTRTQNTSEGTATLFAAANSDTTLTLSTSFTKHVVTRSLGSFKGLSLEFVLDHGSLGTNDGFEITQIQLEEGDGSQFEHLNISEELSQCQRYCYVWKSSVAYSNMGTGYMNSATGMDVIFNLPQIMRASPSFSSSGSFRIVGYDSGSQYAQGLSSLAMTRSHPHTPYLRGTFSSGGVHGAVGEFGDNGSNDAIATFEADF